MKPAEKQGRIAGIRDGLARMLGLDVTKAPERRTLDRATKEKAKYLGLASGADADKKRRRKIRLASQRRNRR